MTATDNRALVETLRQAQRFGFFGSAPIEQAIEHAETFVTAAGRLAAGARIVDLGSGGGLPGLVLADAFPNAAVLLIDRRQKRTDFLSQAVRRLGFGHVEVICDDTERLRAEVVAGTTPLFDLVTARGFGPPETTLRLASTISAPEGAIVISEPPTGDRWEPDLLRELGLSSERIGAVRRFHRAAT